eukprot:COSAG05_NODE_23515_length_257_cov_0.974684_2_plen_60_part_01
MTVPSPGPPGLTPQRAWRRFPVKRPGTVPFYVFEADNPYRAVICRDPSVLSSAWRHKFNF